MYRRAFKSALITPRVFFSPMEYCISASSNLKDMYIIVLILFISESIICVLVGVLEIWNKTAPDATFNVFDDI